MVVHLGGVGWLAIGGWKHVKKHILLNVMGYKTVMHPTVEWIRLKKKHLSLKQTKSKWNNELFFLEVFENFDFNFSEPHRLHRDGFFLGGGTLKGHFGRWSGFPLGFKVAPKKIPRWRRLATNWFMAAVVRNLSWLNWDFLAICSMLTSIVVFFLDDLGRTSFLLRFWWVY